MNNPVITQQEHVLLLQQEKKRSLEVKKKKKKEKDVKCDIFFPLEGLHVQLNNHPPHFTETIIFQTETSPTSPRGYVMMPQVARSFSIFSTFPSSLIFASSILSFLIPPFQHVPESLLSLFVPETLVLREDEGENPFSHAWFSILIRRQLSKQP